MPGTNPNGNKNGSGSSSNRSTILVVGSANQDLVSTTDALPALGETVMGRGFAIECGGKGANQAVAAALLGMAPVEMVCRVGCDGFGDNLLGNFESAGVACDRESTVIAAGSGGKTGTNADANAR
jgi:ribokinase